MFNINFSCTFAKKHKLKRTLIIALFFLTYVVGFSQEQASWSISAASRYGFIFPHRSSIAYLVRNHIVAYDVTFSKQLSNAEKWDKWYRYPNVGGGLYLANLGNPDYLGSAYAVYGFIDVPISWHTSTIRYSYSIATGVAYLTKHFDIKDNYYNIAIGSSLNAFVDFGLMAHHTFQHVDIAGGLCYTHYSNGAWSKPNLGLNIPTVKLNISILTKPYTLCLKKVDTLLHKNMEWSVMLAGGIRQNTIPGSPHYFASTLAFVMEKQVSIRRKIGLGLDVFYDPSIPPRMAENPEMTPASPYVRMGLRFSHDLIFSKVSITMQAGSYFYDPKLPDGYIYSRFGLRYKINSWLQANLLLKTHFFKADIIEFGVSFYKQKRKPQ
jgi:hypothetical protein